MDFVTAAACFVGDFVAQLDPTVIHAMYEQWHMEPTARRAEEFDQIDGRMLAKTNIPRNLLLVLTQDIDRQSRRFMSPQNAAMFFQKQYKLVFVKQCQLLQVRKQKAHEEFLNADKALNEFCEKFGEGETS